LETNLILFDSHCHLTDQRFHDDVDAVVANAAAAGVARMITVSSTPDDSENAIRLAERYENIWTTTGIHPHSVADVGRDAIARVADLAERPKVVALGETGLDYYYDNSPRDVQREVFRRQLALAKKVDLPVIVHTRDADGDTEELLKQVAPTRGVLHCFTSSDKLAEFAVSIGFFISFSGIVTFPNAKALAEIARRIPTDRILVETDCPYLAPVPHRGKRNEPSFVADTARFVAGLRGISVDELAAQTSANFDRLFALKTS